MEATRRSGPARIATVIVNYRTGKLVIENLPGLVEQLRAFPGSAVYVVDNASPGGDAGLLRRFVKTNGLGSTVRVIASPDNGGFARGNNLAFAEIRRSPRPDYIFLLNPDAKALPGAVAALADFLDRHPSAGVAGARLENADGGERSAAFHFPSLTRDAAATSGVGLLVRVWPTVWSSTDGPQRVDWVSGAAMMFRAAMLDDVGDFDGGYFLYFEETDWMLAATRQGYEIWRIPAARVAHAAGSSTGIVDGKAKKGRTPAYWFASWLRYYAKNHGFVYARAAAVAKLTAALIYVGHRRLRGRPVELAEGFTGDFFRQCVLGQMPADLGRGERR